MSKVKVAVRVRPMNERGELVLGSDWPCCTLTYVSLFDMASHAELAIGASCVVDMEQNQTILSSTR